MRKISVIAIILLLFSACAFCSDDKYVASPIIFVHGFGGGNWNSWQSARNVLKEYFFDDLSQLQYDYINLDNIHPDYYPPFPKIEYPGNVGVDEASIYLKRAVSRALFMMPECASTEKKIILVAHSMGGLAIRKFLKDNPQYVSRIKKIIFVGTPHRGSPLANFVYILNSINRNYLPGLIEEQKYKAFDIGNIYSSGLSDSELAHEYLSRLDLTKQLEGYKFILDISTIALKSRFANIDPAGKAIEHLMLSDYDVQFQETLRGVDEYSGFTTEYIYLPATPYIVHGSSTFTGSGGLQMPESNTYSIIASQKPDTQTAIDKIMGVLIRYFEPGFTFPPQESLDSIKTSGDGIVSLQSQSNGQNIPPSLNVFHTDEPGEFAKQILSAIDDEPVIESMYIVSADKLANRDTYSVYLVARVKEYLLADIRFLSFCVDGWPGNLSEFYEPRSGYEFIPFKPYNKFKKCFLMEREEPELIDKDGNILTLHPGEFYLRIGASGNEAHTVSLKMQNPAGKESNEMTLRFQRPLITEGQPVDIIEDLKPAIKARIYSPLGVDIDLNSIDMRLDDIPVLCSVSGLGSDIAVFYVPPDDLERGTHNVKINVRDINGIPAKEETWTFVIPWKAPIITDETPARHVAENPPAISARIYSPMGAPINLSSLIMKLDYNVVSHSVSGNGSDITVSYTPLTKLSHGSHTASLSGEDTYGQYASKTWTFDAKNIIDWEETWSGGAGGKHRYCKGYFDSPYSYSTTMLSYKTTDDDYGVLQGDHIWEIKLSSKMYADGFYDTYGWETWGVLDGSCIGSSGGVEVNIKNTAFTEVRRGDLPYVFYRGWRKMKVDSKAEIRTTIDPLKLYITEDSELTWSGTGVVRLRLNHSYNFTGYGPYSPGTYSLSDLIDKDLRAVFVEFIYDDSDKAFAELEMYEVGTNEDENTASARCGSIKITNLQVRK